MIDMTILSPTCSQQDSTVRDVGDRDGAESPSERTTVIRLLEMLQSDSRIDQETAMRSVTPGDSVSARAIDDGSGLLPTASDEVAIATAGGPPDDTFVDPLPAPTLVDTDGVATLGSDLGRSQEDVDDGVVAACHEDRADVAAGHFPELELVRVREESHKRLDRLEGELVAVVEMAHSEATLRRAAETGFARFKDESARRLTELEERLETVVEQTRFAPSKPARKPPQARRKATPEPKTVSSRTTGTTKKATVAPKAKEARLSSRGGKPERRSTK